MFIFSVFETPVMFLKFNLIIIITLLLNKNFSIADCHVEELIQEIIKTYFRDFRCIVFITEGHHSCLDYISTDSQVFYIQFGSSDSKMNEIEESDTLDSAAVTNGTKYFERLLTKSLDAGCRGYFIQASNPRSVVYSFARTTRRTVTRYDRYYILLSTSLQFDVQDIFTMKEMNFMPNLIVVKASKADTCNTQPANFNFGLNAISFKTLFINYQTNVYEKKKLDNSSNIHKSLNSTLHKNVTMFEEIKTNEELNYCLEIVTHRFVGKEHSNHEILLDIWETDTQGYQFRYKKDLFPDKVKNLFGKELQLTSFPWAQFLVVDYEADPPIEDGMEILIFREFSKYCNATWKLKLNIEDLWGHISDNGSGNGLLGDVVIDTADFSFAALYIWYSTFQWLDFTHCYSRGELICMAPKPKMTAKWLTPFLPFAPVLWLAVGVSLLIIALAFNCIAKASYKYLGASGLDRYFTLLNSALLTMGLFVEQSPPDNAEQSDSAQRPIRSLIASILLFALLFSTGYSSGLSSVLTVPQFEKPIDTIEDFAEHNMKWAANHIIWTWSIAGSDEPVLKTVLKNFQVMDGERITALAEEAKLSFPLERIPGGHFAIGLNMTEQVTDVLRLMKEPLYWSHIVILSRKNSAYLTHLNTIISRLNSGGIILYWEGAMTRKYFSTRMQIAITRSVDLVKEDGPINLTFGHLEGAFFILGFGLLLAFFVFIFEHFKNLCQAK